MTAAPAIKGWCPTLLSPMQSGDGWLARVKPSAGMLSAEAARLIADAARRHGNGHIDLTSRANLQVRGLSPRSAEDFAETIIAAGLANTNPIAGSRSAMSWRARLGPTIPPPPSTLMLSRATSKPCLPASPRFGRCRPNSASSSMAAACCRLQDITADIMVRAHEGKLAVQSRRRDACSVVRPPLAHRNGEGLGARLPSPVCATEREAAPHARAGDGGRRGGDLRRGRS